MLQFVRQLKAIQFQLEAEQEEPADRVLEVRVQLLLRLEYPQQEGVEVLHNLRLVREDPVEEEAGAAQERAVLEIHLQ